MPGSIPGWAATLTITTTGTNPGAVGVIPTAQVCNPSGGGTCVFTIAVGTEVRIAANSPSTPGVFSGGTGDAAACGPTSTCRFTISGDSSIVATFNAGVYPSVQITLAGDGKGEVGSNNNRCQNFELDSSACTVYYAAGSEVTLEGRSLPGNIFTSFSAGTGGAAACAATPCVFTLAATSAVTASFAALASVSVQPATATINAGQTQGYGATGTFSNSATRPLVSGIGRWRTNSAMLTPRYGASAGALGQRVFVVGGATVAAPLAVVEAYNPVSGNWTGNFTVGVPFASMPTPRESFAAAAIGAELYTAGGRTTGGGAVSVLESFNPATNAWTTRAPMPAPRAALGAGVINGILYAVGGELVTPLDTLEAYDPGGNSWTPLAPMPTPRRSLAVAVAGGLLYAIGGDAAGTVEAYDPVSNTWSAKAPLPTPRSGLAAGTIDGLIYAVGGSNAATSGVVEVYNPATNAWSTVDAMPTARDEIALAVLDGRLFVSGGKTGAGGGTLVAAHQEFRPPEATWWSSAVGVATIQQNPSPSATGIAAGTASIIARAVGVDCSVSSSCGTLTVAPGSPGAPGAPVVSGSGNIVTFSWSAPSGAPVTSYSLVARLVLGGPIVATLPVGAATSTTVTAPDGTFVVSVQASNAAGTGPESAPVTVTLPFVPVLPGAPQNLVASLSGTTATITWSPPASGGVPTGYHVQVSLSPAGAVLVSLPTTATSLVVPGVPPGVFYLRVVAVNAAGTGPASNEAVINAAGCALPDVPSGLSVGHAGGTATASWNAVAGAVSYTVFVQPGSGGSFAPAGTVTGLSVSAPVGSGVDVWVSVAATNSCGSSLLAPAVRLTVP